MNPPTLPDPSKFYEINEKKDSQEIQLLKKWLKWQIEDPNAPAKIPGGVHIETLVFLIERSYENS